MTFPFPGSSPQRTLGPSAFGRPMAGVTLELKSKSVSTRFAARGTSLLLVQKRSTQEKTTHHLALAGHSATAPALLYLRHPCRRHARQVREAGPGFSTGHPALAKRSRHPCRLPCGPVVPPHRRTGALGRAARHPGPHSVRHRCAVAKAQEPRARDPASSGIFQGCESLNPAKIGR